LADSPQASTRSLSETSLVLLPQTRHGSRSSRSVVHHCPYCPKKRNTLEQLHCHMTECKLARVHSCNVCFKRFKARGGLQQHLRIHDPVKRFTCSVCQMRFTQKSHLDQHIRIHIGARPFLCRYCGRPFRQKSHQIGHEHTHSKRNGCLVSRQSQMNAEDWKVACPSATQSTVH
ncbi:hypothetical protein PENTCL1PPCAC_20588, partial [Pristionchus entomophagus]